MAKAQTDALGQEIRVGDHDKIDDGANEPEGQDHFEEEDDDE